MAGMRRRAQGVVSVMRRLLMRVTASSNSAPAAPDEANTAGSTCATSAVSIKADIKIQRGTGLPLDPLLDDSEMIEHEGRRYHHEDPGIPPDPLQDPMLYWQRPLCKNPAMIRIVRRDTRNVTRSFGGCLYIETT
jgi:hypothetical protein